MTIDTFERLVAEPSSKKVFLAEIKPGELLLSWTLTAAQTYTYEKAYLKETITHTDETTEEFKKVIVELKEDGAALTELGSIAAVEAASGSWWHDTVNGKLYVHPSGDDSPINYTMTGYFWLRLGTKGTVLAHYEDFTRYKETDPNDRIGIEKHLIAFTGLTRNEDAYVYRDLGANYFDGDFVHQLETQVTAQSDVGFVPIWTLANNIDECWAQYSDGNGNIFLAWFWDGDSYELYLREYPGDSSFVDDHTAESFSASTTYYITIIRDESIGTYGTLYAYIYSNSNRTTLIDTLSIALTAKKNFRYIYAVQTYNDATVRSLSGTVSNLNLGSKKYYEPYISEKGLPTLKIGNPDVYWGITQISGGRLVLLNGNGFFDQIYKRWLWVNKPVRLLMGGEDLPYSEYKLLRTNIIVGKTHTRDTVTLDLKPKAHDFYRKVPVETFTIDTYSSMDPNLEGEVIPIAYGLCHSHEALPAFCIAQSLGGDQYGMKVLGHAVHSFMAAYINYGAEESWETLAMDSSSLGNATFVFTSGSYTPGSTDVKVALVGVTSGGGYLSKPAHIIEHFLTTYCDVATVDISSLHLAQSLARTEASLTVPIIEEVEAIDVIDGICRSDLAFFDEDETGKFRYRTWHPVIATSYTLIDEKLISKHSIEDDIQQLFWQIKVGYRHDPIEDEYVYASAVNSTSKFKYDQAETLVHKTYLNDKSDAERQAQRLLYLMRDPSPKGDFELKTAIVDNLLGDQIKVTLDRSPFGTAGGWVGRRFELTRLDLSLFPVKSKAKAFDMKEFGGGVGFWTGTVGVTSYGGATEDQKLAWGFWCGTDDMADPNDPDSLNASVWW